MAPSKKNNNMRWGDWMALGCPDVRLEDLGGGREVYVIGEPRAPGYDAAVARYRRGQDALRRRYIGEIAAERKRAAQRERAELQRAAAAAKAAEEDRLLQEAIEEANREREKKEREQRGGIEQLLLWLEDQQRREAILEARGKLVVARELPEFVQWVHKQAAGFCYHSHRMWVKFPVGDMWSVHGARMTLEEARHWALMNRSNACACG